MAVMMYYMWNMKTSMTCPPKNMTFDASNISMSVAADLVNVSMRCLHHTMMDTMCQPQMTMIVAGLSLKNFLLFIFCFPCQVGT
jgi:hypothetical protein